MEESMGLTPSAYYTLLCYAVFLPDLAVAARVSEV